MPALSPTPALFLGALGATYAAPGAEASALSPEHEATVTAIAGRLIPGDEHWPSAADVGAAEHLGAILALAPQLVAAVLALVDAAGDDFAAETSEQQDARLRAIEASPEHAAAFRAVYEWVCEAYYRHPLVEPVVLERTGFDTRRPLAGTPMAPFDESRLDRVKALPPRYREVPA